MPPKRDEDPEDVAPSASYEDEEEGRDEDDMAPLMMSESNKVSKSQEKADNSTEGRRRLWPLLVVAFALVGCGVFAVTFAHQTQGHREDESPSLLDVSDIQASEEECSCMNSQAPVECCQRSVLSAHKFGRFLSRKLFRQFHESLGKIDHINPNSIPNATDYRHVIIVRNLFEAVASGYLYHKSGHECWLSPNGEAREANHHLSGWEKTLTFEGLFPAANDRNLCKYLAEESEEDGLRVYIDLLLSKDKWYRGILPYWQEMERRVENGEPERSLFVCHEDVTDPVFEEFVFDEMVNWLFPGGQEHEFPEKLRHDEPYTGGHSSDHDPKLRAHLRRVVKDLDATVFGMALGTLQSKFECGE